MQLDVTSDLVLIKYVINTLWGSPYRLGGTLPLDLAANMGSLEAFLEGSSWEIVGIPTALPSIVGACAAIVGKTSLPCQHHRLIESIGECYVQGSSS